MPIECLISFDNNPQGVYYAGQELSGVVDLSVDATKRIKGEPKSNISILPECILRKILRSSCDSRGV